MAEYVVFRMDVHEPVSEVYFEYSLGDAVDKKEELEDAGGTWEIAEVLPTDSWLIKLLLWLHKRSK